MHWDDQATTHEEADVIIVHHNYKLTESRVTKVTIVSDDTDVFAIVFV